jgi:DNA invertase Pin-like site-specific DNA recombinase
MITSPKVEPRHLRLRALVYVRQSTPQQLQNNQESTRRQYQLAERAQQMGWPVAQVHVIDDDLGLSGASSDQRGGFQRLVASIGLGEVGIILVTEVSRLSRCNSDWHRVIELCAVFATLIADEDGVYDPRDPNDRLLLGVKGTLFAAELHILQARMRGGLINKAQRGALAVTLPIGFRRTKDGVMLDPDEAVRLAIATVFERFGVLRNARAVQRHFLTNGLKLPRLIQSGPETGQIVWVRPSSQMLHRMLVNPAYAGTFVYGRTRREVTPGDPPAIVDRRLAPEAWDIVVPDVYPAYLSFDAYLANRRQLADNLYNFAQKRRGAPREGSALLAGLIRCGRCGRQMGVGYGHGAPRYHCRGAQNAYGEPQCQSVAVRDIDQAVSSAFLDAVQPAGIEAMLVAIERLEDERRAIDRQWQLRLERARYDARLAQRQYDAVAPANRLVARTLEQRWNAALAAIEALEAEYGLLLRTALAPLSAAEIDEVRALATDLPALWHADTTTPVDRKRLLRLVIAAVTVTVDRPQRTAVVEILWSGGATTQLEAHLPPLGHHLRTAADVLTLIRELTCAHPDHAIAAQLNARGLRTRQDKPWTYARVASMRRQHGIATACPIDTRATTARADGLVSLRAAAERLGLAQATIRIWAHRGVVSCDQRCAASKLWVRLTAADVARLDGSATPSGLTGIADVMRQDQITREAVWDRVRAGRYVAYRVRHGLERWQWGLRPTTSAASRCMPPDCAQPQKEPHYG